MVVLLLGCDKNFESLLTFWGPNWQFLGSGYGSKPFLESTHVVEQLAFSMIPSILTFEFDLTLG